MGIEKAGCPFCGSKHPTVWHIAHFLKPWVVECRECQATGPHGRDEKEAIELWNKRMKE